MNVGIVIVAIGVVSDVTRGHRTSENKVIGIAVTITIIVKIELREILVRCNRDRRDRGATEYRATWITQSKRESFVAFTLGIVNDRNIDWLARFAWIKYEHTGFSRVVR